MAINHENSMVQEYVNHVLGMAQRDAEELLSCSTSNEEKVQALEAVQALNLHGTCWRLLRYFTHPLREPCHILSKNGKRPLRLALEESCSKPEKQWIGRKDKFQQITNSKTSSGKWNVSTLNKTGIPAGSRAASGPTRRGRSGSTMYTLPMSF